MAVKSNVIVITDTLAEFSQIENSAPVGVCKETGTVRYKDGTWKDTLSGGFRDGNGVTLPIGAIGDGQVIKRVGNSLVGANQVGGVDQMIVPLVSDAAGVTWTNMPLALTFFGGSHRFAVKLDLTPYAQVRLIVNKQATAGASGSIVRLRYRTTFDATVANWLQIGDPSSVQVAVNVQNTILDSGWINLVAGAKADVFVVLDGQGGDGALDPSFGSIVAQFR